jgi:acetyltransferase-like isoleucine patch superfamily enzyme
MEDSFSGLKNRILQFIAHFVPGARSVRVWLHRRRGVKLGNNVWIGYDAILETSRPYLINIGNNSIISMRAMIIAHFRGAEGVWIDDDVFVGPGAIILPGVRIGKGAVVTAGSVVAASVAPGTVVQGNPARAIARCTVGLTGNDSLSRFYRSMKPLKSPPTTRPGSEP